MSAGIQLLTADIVVPMTRETDILVDAGVAIEGDTIVAVDGIAELRTRFPAAPERHLADHVLIPGLINGHHHSGLLRGTAGEASCNHERGNARAPPKTLYDSTFDLHKPAPLHAGKEKDHGGSAEMVDRRRIADPDPGGRARLELGEP